MDKLIAEEEKYVFSSFTHKDAWFVGNEIISNVMNHYKKM